MRWADRTHCKHGHEFTNENTLLRGDGARICRACGREAVRRCRERDPMANVWRQRRHRYGVEREEYEAILARQGGVCGICGRDEKLVIDHDHETGEIRGLLCHRCNFALGAVEDDIRILSRAIAYLEERE